MKTDYYLLFYQMATKRFHELFVDHAVGMTSDYDKEIKDLKYEIKKLKAILRTIRVSSEHDLEVDGTFRDGYDMIGEVDSTLWYDIDGNGTLLFPHELDYDSINYSEETDKLSVVNQNDKRETQVIEPK